MKTKLYKYTSFKEKIEPYLTDAKAQNTELKQFILPKRMSDSEIQKATSSTPIPVEVFGSFIDENIEKLSKDEYYIFHVQTPDGVVAVDLFWGADEWLSRAYRFGDDDVWREGGIFLSSATALGTSNIDPLNSLTLEKAIEICKENGLTITKIY